MSIYYCTEHAHNNAFNLFYPDKKTVTHNSGISTCSKSLQLRRDLQS